MEPARTAPGTIVDLLDRVLDKGLVLNADIIISLAGVPLIGINLRAALAGMETMVRHGLMAEWDQRLRAQGLALAGEKGWPGRGLAQASLPTLSGGRG